MCSRHVWCLLLPVVAVRLLCLFCVGVWRVCLSLLAACGDARDMLLQVVTGFCRQTQVAPAGHRLLQPAWDLLHSAFACHRLPCLSLSVASQTGEGSGDHGRCCPRLGVQLNSAFLFSECNQRAVARLRRCRFAHNHNSPCAMMSSSFVL